MQPTIVLETKLKEFMEIMKKDIYISEITKLRNQVEEYAKWLVLTGRP